MGESLASLFESVLFSVFLVLFLEPKKGKKELFLGIVLTSGLLFLNISISDYLGIYYVYIAVDLIIMIFFWKIFLKGSLTNFLLAFALYYFGIYSSAYLPTFILSFVEPGIILAFQSIGTVYRVGILVTTKILLLFYVIVVIRFREKFWHHKQGISTLFYSIFPILIILFFILLASILTDLYKIKPALGIRMTGIMAGVHIIVTATVCLSVHAVRMAEEEYDVEKLSYMLTVQRESLEKFIDQEKQMYRLKHELEHMLYTVQYLFEKNRNEEGLRIMKEMICELCGDARDISVSQNIVDTIIANIKKKYETEGICIEKEILFPDETIIELVDLCVLMGDLLDNAMEAAAKSTEKRVEIRVREEYNCLYLTIANTFSEKNSDVKTFVSKKEAGLHGFGLRNVREIVRRYGGELITYAEGEWFYSDVVIYGKK